MATLFRSHSIASKLITGSQILGTAVNPVVTPAAKEVPVLEKGFGFKVVSQQVLPIGGTHIGPFSCGTATKGINVIARRYAHTDVHFPSFDDVRRNDTMDPTVPARESEDLRRAEPSAIYYGVGGMLSLIVAKETLQTLVKFKWLPADQRALASIEVDLNEIPEGQVKSYEWRGKPIFVKHRTQDDIARENEVSMSELRHPEKDKDRVQNEEWLVVLGVCTHLGCIPIANAGDYPGGYFCPCHGSHYDGSGRVRKGPAPLNLEVPEHTFNGNILVVGKAE